LDFFDAWLIATLSYFSIDCNRTTIIKSDTKTSKPRLVLDYSTITTTSTTTTTKMPIRNPFARRPDVHTGLNLTEENLPPNGTRPTFEKVDTMGSKSSAMSIKSGHSQEPPEYKMSGMLAHRTGATRAKLTYVCPAIVVNDSGVYLPVKPPSAFSKSIANIIKPSPPAEKKGLWPRRSNISGTSNSTRNSEDIEAFSISRESFDSYRRSFVRLPP
jgi:hypothetical protein